jgi:hypothetical protein
MSLHDNYGKGNNRSYTPAHAYVHELTRTLHAEEIKEIVKQESYNNKAYYFASH